MQYLALRHLERIAAEQAAAINGERGFAAPDDSDAEFFPAMLPEGYVDPASNGTVVATRSPARSAVSMAAGHRKRFTSFSLIGGLVFLLGLGVQYLLHKKVHAGNTMSYLGNAVFSIELSFMLNRTITWKDRKVSLGSAFVKFNVQKLIMTIPNTLIYTALIKFLGVNWLVSAVSTMAVFTVLNYITGDLWAFATSGAVKMRDRIRHSRPFPAITAPLPVLSDLSALPTVSVVIPCKGNEKTIRATVEGLLRQDYPALAELILVGDVGDSTWTALRDITDRRLVLLEQERTPGRRDPNIKRAKGLRYASGQVLAMADSDIVMDPDWLSQAVRLLYLQGSGLVAGGMRTMNNTFWGRFVDKNVLAAKTPRIPQPYNVTSVNFGKKGFKPPITANAVFTRDLYTKCSLDTEWAYGYEDYEWFWRVARNGHNILYSDDLTAAHHHRGSFKKLLREYRQSSYGCARFVLVHPDSPLARKRLRQAIILPLVALAGLAGSSLAVAAGYGLYALAVGALGLCALSAKEVVTSKSLEAAVYPPLSMLLALTFAFNLSLSLARLHVQEPGLRRPVTAAINGGNGRHTRRTLAIVVGVLIVGTAVRLLNIGNMPEWQLDEITYWSLARNLVVHKSLYVPLTLGQAWQPFVYHPPFYLWLLADWYRIVGTGITQSRILGVLSEMIALGLLSRMLTRLYGPQAATFATILIVFDGWMLYVGRVSYIENTCLVIMLVGLSLYIRALRTGKMSTYVAAGAVIGFAGVYNNDAAYLIGVLVVHWLMIGRRNTREHVAAVAVGVSMFGLYGLMMSKLFTVAGENWWWHDTLVQINRVTGGQKSAGTLNNPLQFVTLITNQYALFVPSVLLAAISAIILFRRLAYCGRLRDWSPLGRERLLPAWAVTAVVIFGGAGLHFSQYFVMFLLPLYSYLWVNLWPWLVAYRARLIPAFVSGVVLMGCTCVALRLSHDSSAFRQWQQYAATKIPKNALLVAGTTGDPLAYVINQPFCSPGGTMSPVCFQDSEYLITWQTTLQSANPLHLQQLAILLGESRKVATFHQFSGEIDVYQINRPASGGK